MWQLIGLICGGLVVLAWIALFCFYGYWGVQAFRKSKKHDEDPDVTLIPFKNRDWGYRFVDPYGGKVLGLGHRSKEKALEAAIAHRKRVGLKLEEAVGYHLPAYQPEINKKEETHE